jgi:AI-2 transport protein TqsA
MMSLAPRIPRRYELTVIAVIGTIAALKLASHLLVPIALALFVAVVGLPLLQALMNRGVPRGAAIGLVMVVFAAAFWIMGWMALASAKDLRTKVPVYAARLGVMEKSGREYLAQHDITLPDVSPTELVAPERIVEFATHAMGAASELVVRAVLVLLLTVFILIEAAGFREKIRRALGRDDVDFGPAAKAARDVQRYLVVKTVINLAIAALVGVFTSLIGLDFPLLWALLMFLLHFIPNVGGVLAAIPAVLVALLQFGPGMALVVAAGYLVSSFLIGHVLEPTIIGKHTSLSILAVLLSLLFWEWVWGAPGMFLSVPLTLALKVSLENSAEYRWLAVLMGPVSTRRRAEPAISLPPEVALAPPA